MQRPSRSGQLTALATGILILGLTACSDSSAPNDLDFTPQLTSDVGAAQADEIEEAIEAFRFEGIPPAVVTSEASFALAGPLRPRRASCAMVENTTDTDEDGTPDEATFTFALPACHFSNFRGGTLDITGIIVVSDPTPANADFAVHLSLDDFRILHTNPDQTRSYSTTRNGTRALTASASSASLTNTVTTVRSATGRLDATISHNTMLTFTPDEGEMLVRGEPLPDGLFETSGTLIWVRGGRSRTFTVTTEVPLRWDASCTSDRKISEGEVHWTLSNGSYIKTVWTACGVDPTRTFVPAN